MVSAIFAKKKILQAWNNHNLEAVDLFLFSQMSKNFHRGSERT